MRSGVSSALWKQETEGSVVDMRDDLRAVLAPLADFMRKLPSLSDLSLTNIYFFINYFMADR